MAVFLVLASFAFRAAARGDESCWGPGVDWDFCCAKSHGPTGNADCWEGGYNYGRCCPEPNAPAALEETGQPYPSCARQQTVLYHDGENGVFADVSLFGTGGCFMNDCKKSDKFNAADPAICGRACMEVEECTHWSFGDQQGAKKCFLRKSDAARGSGRGWTSGTKACGPPRLPDGFVALTAAYSEGLLACDLGKGETCPDPGSAINTWIFAIKHLRRAFEGRVDAETMSHIYRIEEDSSNFKAGLTAEYRPSDKDFPRVVYNNRLIVKHLYDSLAAQPKVELDPNDVSLPSPLRSGKLCGKDSCYEL